MTDTNYQAPAAEHPFAPYVRILGKGKTGSRSLSQDEARDAFGMILRGETEALQLGAFLMLLRVKEETPQELAGFAQACREQMQAPPQSLRADLDWSSYAGKKHQHPWYIPAMLLLVEAGYKVFVHGSDGHTPGRLYTEKDSFGQLGLPVASQWQDVQQQLASDGLCYLPLRHFCAPLHQMMQLRPLLGLRSPVNTLARMINPLRAPASIQSIFHPAYGVLHQETDRILGQPAAMVFKGDSGEVEVKPQADTSLQLLRAGQTLETLLPRSLSHRAERVDAPSVTPLRALWRGQQADDYGLSAVLATCSAALLLLEPDLSLDAARQRSTQLWHSRNIERLP